MSVRSRRGLSIRSTWWRAMALLVAIVATMGVGSVAFTRYQRDVFAETTERFKALSSEFADLNQAMVLAEVPLGGVLYELDHRGPVEEQWAEFQAQRRRADAAFGSLQRMLPGSEDLHRAEASWLEAKAGVVAARSMWGTGEVAAALARGEDPFAPSVWMPLSETYKALAETNVTSVAAMRARAAAVERRQAQLEPVLIAAVLAALLLSLYSGWRLSRRIVLPLLTLRDGVRRIRDGGPTEEIELPPAAGRELAELAASMREMTKALNESQTRLRDQAYLDGLTNLANRRALTEHLDQLFHEADDQTLALLLIDLDDFKYVNDSMGHDAGDQLLAAVANRLESSVRDGDLVARLGGDEFAIVVRGDEAPTVARKVAERVLASLEDPVIIEGVPLHVGTSIGIAHGQPEAADQAELLRNADVAMYMAKSQGKHCVNTFDSAMHTSILSRTEAKRELAAAVENEQLELHYQPVIDLDTNEILGFEALVRWRHPERGLLPPAEFIGLAEETGDIVTIGNWVIDQACRDLAIYQAEAGRADLWMAINVSGHQVLASSFTTVVREALTRHRLAPAVLVLEITEQVLLTDTAKAASVLGELRAEGIRVAIDDFGTGFSSLRYLHELPVDIIKIDRSFVSEEVPNQERELVLQAIVAMGRGLGLALIAEGIELPSERERLCHMGPMAGQGYLIARPMPAAQASALLGHDAFVPGGQHPTLNSIR